MALTRAVGSIAPGRRVNVIGRAIEATARRGGYRVVQAFTGHGLGTALFNGLIIPSYEDPHSELVMEPGHTFTVHPILTLGPPDHVVDDDKWTIRTKTGRRSAEAMHTVLVTEKGAEILTETGSESLSGR